MADVVEAAPSTLESERASRLDSIIAVLVAVSATFMGLCNIKDGNIVQGMSQAQADKIDSWSYYQAKSTKQHVVETALDQLTLQMEIHPNMPADARGRLQAKIDAYRREIERYENEKQEIKTRAEGLQKEYDRLNVHDDQFDMAEATLSLGIALYGLTALTRKRWLFGFGVVFTVLGTVLGLAGFLGWNLHPDFLARLLT